MPPRSCRVTIQDLDNVEHTVQVTAASLFEAVALGIASLRAKEWVAGIPEGLNPVKVCVTDIPVEHHVRIKDFIAWLHRSGTSPRDQILRNRIREILGFRQA
ncbi:MAG TPA: hypothetical protein VJS43_14115 [Candidatus Acidoferrales bacterium]|nr:hypothetical protein [Candidatus Acidoferrales bacterium]